MKLIEEMAENRINDEKRRQEDEEKRQRERKEDKEAIKSMVREIKEGVKDEIMEVIKPWQERTVGVEESTEVMREEVRRLAGDVRDMREELKSRQEVRSYADRAAQPRGAGVAVLTGANSVPIGGVLGRGGGGKGEGEGEEEEEEKKRIRGLMDRARKVIGLKPIDKRHVEQMLRRLEVVEGETEEEMKERAKLAAVKLFFKDEMRMKEENMEALTIVKIFPPAKEDWNTLYVELASSEMVQYALSFTSYMRRGTVGEDRVEVVSYIPRDLYTRWRAITALGNKARLDSDKKTSFRVTFGREDFVLQMKARGSLGWGPHMALPADLPAFERHVRAPHGARSPGEAPGRPALTPEQRRKRARDSLSPSGASPLPKRLLDLAASPAGEGLLAAASARDTNKTTDTTNAKKNDE